MKLLGICVNLEFNRWVGEIMYSEHIYMNTRWCIFCSFRIDFARFCFLVSLRDKLVSSCFLKIWIQNHLEGTLCLYVEMYTNITWINNTKFVKISSKDCQSKLYKKWKFQIGTVTNWCQTREAVWSATADFRPLSGLSSGESYMSHIAVIGGIVVRIYNWIWLKVNYALMWIFTCPQSLYPCNTNAR